MLLRVIILLCTYSLVYSQPADGLVAYFPFDGNTNDESGNGLHGSAIGASLTTDRFSNANSAYSFDGTGDYIEIDAVAPHLTGQGQGTLSLWFQTSSENHSAPLMWWNDDNRYFPLGAWATDLPDCSIGFASECPLTVGYLNGSEFYFDGQWHFAVFTMGSEYHALFVDGQMVELNYDTGTPASGNCLWNAFTEMRIGRRTSGGEWAYEGNLDDVRIYNRDLSGDEIISLYHEGNWSIEDAVSNMTASQRTDGSKLVDIYYNLSGTSQYYEVSLEASLEGDTNYTPISSASGDVRFGVTPGNGKHVVWDVGAEYSNQYSNMTKTRIIAAESETPPIVWINIPAGPYTYGSDDEIRNDISYDFMISKYEITNAQYAEFLQSSYANDQIIVSAMSVQGYYGGDVYTAAGNKEFIDLDDSECRISWSGSSFNIAPEYENHPVVQVSWFGSKAFANYYGLRLPNEYEWEKAARGNTGCDYPWGDEITGSNANYLNSGDAYDNGTTPVGYYDGSNYDGFQTMESTSPYGVYDMIGNVWEWCDAWLYLYPGSRMLRGGNYSDYRAEYLFAWFDQAGTAPGASTPGFGFRVAQSPLN